MTRSRVRSAWPLILACLTSCAHPAATIDRPPRLSTPEILPRPVGLVTGFGDGSQLLPADVARQVTAILVHYEDMPRVVAELLEIQQRQDEEHWLAWHDQQIALDDPPMPAWRLAIWVAGGVAAGVGIGALLVLTAPGAR